MRVALSSILLALACPVFAQEGPSFDCANAESSAEALICADAALAALDRRITNLYAQALERAEGVATSDAAETLRAIQRGWIKGRDECWKSEDLRSCVETAYTRREAELVAEWLLQEPTAIVTWTCEGNPANEVVTYFFETTIPSIRFERGDTIAPGMLVPTASGAKYEADFGRSIWIKGDEATYREPDPDGTALTCVVASGN